MRRAHDDQGRARAGDRDLLPVRVDHVRVTGRYVRPGEGGPTGRERPAGGQRGHRPQPPVRDRRAPGRALAPTSARLRLPEGAELLSAEFRSVTRHDFTGELLIPGPGPAEDYVRSMIITQNLPDPEALVFAVSSFIRRAPEAGPDPDPLRMPDLQLTLAT